MSSFTQFSALMSMQFCIEASHELKKDFWLVEEGFRYYIGSLDSGRYIDVPRHFLTDGASVPFFLQWLIPAWGSYGQAAALHDYLCENGYCINAATGENIMLTRKEIDDIFYESMKVLEVETWRYNLIKAGVETHRAIRRPPVPNVKKNKLEVQQRYFMAA